jgi:hypothetical protein
LSGPELSSLAGRVAATFAVKGGTEELLRIAAASPRDAWAVGLLVDPKSQGQVIKHWNGRTWTGVRVPARAAEAWQRTRGPDAPFRSAVAASPGDAWIVASIGGAYLRIAGSRWSVGELPHGGAYNYVGVGSVIAVSNSDVWVFGYLLDENVTAGNVRPYAARFDGHTWTATTVPGSGTIEGASAASPGSIWAVTSPADGGKPAVLHWTRSAGWERPVQPSLPARAELTGVLAEAGGRILAGGSERRSGRAGADIPGGFCVMAPERHGSVDISVLLVLLTGHGHVTCY